MSRIVTGADVWPAIDRLLQPPGTKLIAVAFLGADAPVLLSSLGAGDLLVCDASVSALMSGATSPEALAAFVDRGVTIRSHPELHAKVYLGDRAAFVGSANASASAVRQAEVGVVVTGAGQLRELESFVRAVAASPDSTVVDDGYVTWARTRFRPPRGAARRGGTRGAKRLYVQSYGDVEPPSVTTAAERQRTALAADGDDAAAVVDYSWGAEGAWRMGDRCVWVAREDSEPDSDRWLAQPPALCFDARAVGGSSKKWIFWWRTPAAAELPWGDLHRRVLLRTGLRLELESSTTAAAAVAEVFETFGVSTTDGGLGAAD